jgi:hypothetical protein
LFAAAAFWFFSSGIYVKVMTGVAGWYAEQVMPVPETTTGPPHPT